MRRRAAVSRAVRRRPWARCGVAATGGAGGAFCVQHADVACCTGGGGRMRQVSACRWSQLAISKAAPDGTPTSRKPADTGLRDAVPLALTAQRPDAITCGRPRGRRSRSAGGDHPEACGWRYGAGRLLLRSEQRRVPGRRHTWLWGGASRSAIRPGLRVTDAPSPMTAMVDPTSIGADSARRNQRGAGGA